MVRHCEQDCAIDRKSPVEVVYTCVRCGKVVTHFLCAASGCFRFGPGLGVHLYRVRLLDDGAEVTVPLCLKHGRPLTNKLRGGLYLDAAHVRTCLLRDWSGS